MSFRLASTITTLFFVLQFVLLGSGFSCITPASGDGGMSDMTQMDMERHESASAAQAPGEDHEDCSVPWMPTDAQTMAPCAPAAIASTAIFLLPSRSVRPGIQQLIVLEPRSRTTPPDIPPPRA